MLTTSSYSSNTHKPVTSNIKKHSLNNTQRPRKFSTSAPKSSFTDWPHISYMIEDLVRKERDPNYPNLWECDYSRITSAILPYYFHVTAHNTWVITPEFNYMEDNHPDYTLFKVYINPYRIEIHAVVEIKSKTGPSWNKLLEQMWTQADVSKNNAGRLWAIGQKGLEIWFFRFHILKYQDQAPNWYTNYELFKSS